MRNILTCLFALFTVAILSAQPLNRSTYSTMIQTAEELVEKQDYWNAIDWYQQSYDERKDYDVAIIVAELYLNLRIYDKAERWYRRALNRDKKDVYFSHRLNYAKALKQKGDYDKAIKEFNKVLKEEKDPVMQDLIQNEITGAEMGKVAKNADGVTITSAGKKINSYNSEYSAFLDGNDMYFSSFQKKELIIVDEKTTDYHTKIYKSTKGDKGWGEPSVLDDKINRPGFHNSNITIAPNGKTMYFDRIQLNGNTIGTSKIYSSARQGSSWGPANEVSGVNGDYVAKHPCAGELFGTG